MEFILPIINAFEKQIMKLIPRFYNLIIELVNGDDMRLGTYMKCNNSNNDEQLLVRELVELYEKCDINKSNYLIQQLKTNGFKDGVYIKLLAFQKLFEIYNILVLEKTNEHFDYKMSKLISKEINYMRNYFAHRKVDKVSNEIIQRFYEDLYFYLKLVIIPCDKALLYEELAKEIKVNVKIAMDVNMRDPFSFDLGKEIKVFGGRDRDGFEKAFRNEEGWGGEDVGRYGCTFEEFEKRYLGFVQVELPKYEFVNKEDDIREEIKDKEEGNNQNINNNNKVDDMHGIHSKEHNDSNNNNDDDDNDYSRPIIEQESINESTLNINNVTMNDQHNMNNNNNNNNNDSYSEDNDINM